MSVIVVMVMTVLAGLDAQGGGGERRGPRRRENVVGVLMGLPLADLEV